jgi:hypothetical protein
MTVHPTSGDFLTLGPRQPAAPDPRPVGIVSTRIDVIADYLETCPSPYVIIRGVRDVPASLGGVALLDGIPLPPELTSALSAALLG